MPAPSPSPIHQTPDGVILTVHVQPNAARSEYAGLHGDAVKIRIAAPPVEGAANEAVRRFLSERLGVPLRRVTLLAGQTGRRKRIKLIGVHAKEVTARLTSGGEKER
ncbi:DUF167 domain-containing protein [Candidatus Nitrospira bockiana]